MSGTVLEGVSDTVIMASRQLKVFVSESNLSIHNVPGDGDCLFWSVAYQLNAKNVCNADASELRQIIASYIESHGDFFSGFLAEAHTNTNPFNADTDTMLILIPPMNKMPLLIALY